MAALTRVAARPVNRLGNILERSGRRVNESIGKNTVRLGAVGAGGYTGSKYLDYRSSQAEAEVDQAYLSARERIMNDPNLSPAEKQRRLDQLSRDKRGPSGPSTWFSEMSMTQAFMFVAFGWLSLKAIGVLAGGAA